MFQKTNKTYVDDEVLDSEGATAQLQSGSKIGLGVPLTYYENAGPENPNYIFLKLQTAEISNDEV